MSQNLREAAMLSHELPRFKAGRVCQVLCVEGGGNAGPVLILGGNFKLTFGSGGACEGRGTGGTTLILGGILGPDFGSGGACLRFPSAVLQNRGFGEGGGTSRERFGVVCSTGLPGA